MTSGLWIPGAATSQDEFVSRLNGTISRFAADAGVERAFVEVELIDGSRYTVDSIAAEPGFGFVTLRLHADRDEEDVPDALVVPVATIKRIELARAEEQRERLGFSVRD
jgi:hypothetical protein